jgi:hypothetical protein
MSGHRRPLLALPSASEIPAKPSSSAPIVWMPSAPTLVSDSGAPRRWQDGSSSCNSGALHAGAALAPSRGRSPLSPARPCRLLLSTTVNLF